MSEKPPRNKLETLEATAEISRSMLGRGPQASQSAALEYHRGSTVPAGAGPARPGKIEVVASKSLITQRDLTFAYTPGVAEPCKAIFNDPEAAYAYTTKGNLVGVISNGTAVLGLGNIGALAGKPVMEGKAVLFKKFADIDCFDIEVDTENIDTFVETVASLEPTFGGINLEDIRAPDCFEIERKLRERMQIPVFHDDQHGTAIISGAALLNALELTNRKIEDTRVVFCGGGAASIACARFWLSLGLRKENCIMTDIAGVITAERKEEMNPHKMEFAIIKNAWHEKRPKNLVEAMVNADVFMGCSVSNVVTPEMLKSLRAQPIVFAMANPDPEISYELALEARQDMIFATGRSDYPNQVNNVLGFPFIFRGALDVRAKTINEPMKIAAAKALAKLAKEEVPESVVQAYGAHHIQFGRDYIIPKPFDPRVLLWVAPAVAKAAVESGVSRREIPGRSPDAYRARLEKLLGKTRSVMRDIRDRIVVDGAEKVRKIHIVYPEGTNEKVLKAAAIVKQEHLAEPILLGDPEEIRALIKRYNLEELESCEMIRPSRSPLLSTYSTRLWDLRKRKGFTPALANQLMKDPLYFGAMHVRMGRADAWLCGVSRTYPETIRPTLHVIGSKGGQKVAGVYMLIWKDRVIFLADTTVNIDPSAEDLADIAINTAHLAESLGFEPRVGMLSFSNFGSSDHTEVRKTQMATSIVQRRRPDLVVDGEMQADVAINPKLRQDKYPFCKLKEEPANVLICPNLSAANICYKLLAQVGGAEAVGPILIGMNQPIHVLQLNAEVTEIVNMSIIAVLDAQRMNLHHEPLGKEWGVTNEVQFSSAD